MRGSWLELVPPQWRDGVRETLMEFETGMRRYFRGQSLVAAMVGVLFAVGFAIIGLPLGVLLGLFIGLLNLVPYLQILGMIPAFALALLQALERGSGFVETVLPVALVFGIIQAVQDLVLVPRIMGKQMGLSPWVMLLALSIWGQLLGFLGLIIALPIGPCSAWPGGSGSCTRPNSSRNNHPINQKSPCRSLTGKGFVFLSCRGWPAPSHHGVEQPAHEQNAAAHHAQRKPL